MSDVRKGKCPFCGTGLNIPNRPGIEKKSVNCPICKHASTIETYLATKAKNEVKSQPKADTGKVVARQDDATRYGTVNLTIGRLKLVGTDISYQLKPGNNEIGRQSKNSTVDFAIDTGELRGMSRKHLLIEVVKEPHKGFVHYASLCKQNVNPTTINGKEMCFGVDRIVLHDGAVIKLPDAELRFVIPDEDATEIHG